MYMYCVRGSKIPVQADWTPSHRVEDHAGSAMLDASMLGNLAVENGDDRSL